MRLKNFFFALLLILLAFVPNISSAQSDSVEQKKVLVITTSGVERLGYILSDDGREILLETENLGKIYINKADIVSITEITPDEFDEINGDLRLAGPFTTRYYFTTSAMPIKKGEDYAMINLYGPEVHFAVSENFSLGVMSTWIASPFLLAAKYTFPTKDEKLNFGIGTLFGTSGYLNNFRGYGGLYWGMVTMGSRMNSVTVSAGFLHMQPDTRKEQFYIPGVYNSTVPWASFPDDYPGATFELRSPDPITSPVIGLGAIAKVGQKASFIFDGMLFLAKSTSGPYSWTEDYDPITGLTTVTVPQPEKKSTTVFYLMPGMRFQTKPNRAFQVALAGATIISDDLSLPIPIPMCSWFFKF